MTETIAIFVNEGEISKIEKVKKPLESVIKLYVLRALNSWNANSSDFIVLKSSYLITLKRPIEPSLDERLSKYLVDEKSDEVVYEIPVYEISYSISWQRENFISKKLILVSPYINEGFLELLAREAEKLARGEGEKQG